MVVGGVPVAREDHAAAIANMALEMQSVLTMLAESNGYDLKMRIGINTGAGGRGSNW